MGSELRETTRGTPTMVNKFIAKHDMSINQRLMLFMLHPHRTKLIHLFLAGVVSGVNLALTFTFHWIFFIGVIVGLVWFQLIIDNFLAKNATS